jgi:hemophore-related protein
VHVRSLVAGIGIAAVAVTVPLVVVSAASAQDSPSTSPAAAATCPRLDLRKEVTSYLAAHPDVAHEIATLRALPHDQRAQARRQYLAAHPDVAARLKQFRQDRRGTWAEVAGGRAAELDKYPAVQALVQDLATAPAGQRAAEAKTYLAAHPDARTQLQKLRSDVRARLQTCRAGK